jgi:hypothetical protein
MADPAHDAHGDYHRGDMDIQEQLNTFHAFNGLTKWGSLVLAASLMSLTMWFCTEAGFMAGLITGVLVMVVGILVLRERKGAAH